MVKNFVFRRYINTEQTILRQDNLMTKTTLIIIFL
jgi:hypothetical protein